LGIVLDNRLPFLKQVDKAEIALIRNQVDKNINAPLTSSMGRLFDAVSAIIGLRGVIEYEAQAAIDLEMLAYNASDAPDCYPFDLEKQEDINIIKIRDLFKAIIEDILKEIPESVIAVKFHNTVAQMILQTCQKIAVETGIKRAALSGGVFQNRLLLRKACALLESKGFTVYTHRQVPCNDGGISLGQVVIANANEE
ncbi:MAG: Kae1-like domain-containing protein, partial [Dehalococcoidales bacterium]